MRAAKTPDRMVPGDGGEKLVSREETPVDVNSRSGGPRVVFPPLNQNGNPPPVASVSPTGAAGGGANGTMPNNEPRRIRTLTVKGDAADNGGVPAGAAAPPSRRRHREPPLPRLPRLVPPPARTRASPMPAPTRRCRSRRRAAAAGAAPTRVGSTNPTQPAPAARRAAAISFRSPRRRTRPTRRPPTGRCRASSRACWVPHSPVIKRADLGEKGVYYRAMVGPFGSSEEAVQFCNSLKSAGGQCFVQRN